MSLYCKYITFKYRYGNCMQPFIMTSPCWKGICNTKCYRDTLHWRHNEPDGVSNHQPRDCLLNCLFRCRSKKTSKLRATGLCAENSPGTGEFPAQKASNAENVSIWWRHHEMFYVFGGLVIGSNGLICLHIWGRLGDAKNKYHVVRRMSLISNRWIVSDKIIGNVACLTSMPREQNN